MVETAVIGSKNVIVAAAEAKVKRVVLTSSIGAVYMDPNRSPNELIDETFWSDLEFCKSTEVTFSHSFRYDQLYFVSTRTPLLTPIHGLLLLNLNMITQSWYFYGKVLAERLAWKESKLRGLDIVTISPVLVIGPLLQPTLNASTAHILEYLTGAVKTYSNSNLAFVDVRDVASAHVFLFETPSAKGRYICYESSLHLGEMAEILAKYFPEYAVPTK